MKRYLLLLFCTLINVCLGNVYSWSVFRKSVQANYNISTLESGYPFMIFLFFFSVSMPFAGRFLDKHPSRVFSFFGATVLCAGYILSGFTNTIWELVITYGILGGLGVGVVYAMTVAVPAKWFPEKKGLAVGISLLGFGISPLLTSIVSSTLISDLGLSKTFQFLGIVYFVFLMILVSGIEFPKLSLTLQASHQVHFRLFHFLKERKFLSLWILFFLGSFVGLSTISISAPVVVETVKASAKESALAIAILAIFNGLGRPFYGNRNDVWGIRKSIQLNFLTVIFSGIFIYLFYEKLNYFSIVFFLGLIWASLGGWLAIAPATTARLFGNVNYSVRYGIVFSAYGIGAIIGVMSSGYIRDAFGAYKDFFLVVCILGVLGFLLSYTVSQES